MPKIITYLKGILEVPCCELQIDLDQLQFKAEFQCLPHVVNCR